MPKFRKKPIVIEARELRFDTMEDVKAWCGGQTWSRPPMRAVTGISVKTLHGWVNVEFGSWVAKGDFDFYPIAAEVLAQTYDLLDESPLVAKGE